MKKADDCPLCLTAGGQVLWAGALLRVIAVDDPLHPGYTRVIWQEHLAEMTQLPAAARHALMEAVWRVEQAQRDVLQADKINLAQFGNMVPHLHWHVIPRWAGDSHFPEAIWAPAPRRSPEQLAAWQAQKALIQARLPHYHAALRAAFAQDVAH
ncbi:MAG TPA: HIT family protein [Burkholderiaceae bacterium]|nr:HIT family protein [Burkholderiaceae bacterium]